jgi:hypothetical protein
MTEKLLAIFVISAIEAFLVWAPICWLLMLIDYILQFREKKINTPLPYVLTDKGKAAIKQ